MKLKFAKLMILGFSKCTPLIEGGSPRSERPFDEIKRFLNDIQARDLLYKQLYEQTKMLRNVYHDLGVPEKERFVTLLNCEERVKAVILLCMLNASQAYESEVLRGFVDNATDPIYKQWLKEKMRETSLQELPETPSQISQFIGLLRCIFLTFARIVRNFAELLRQTSQILRPFMCAYLVLNLFCCKLTFGNPFVCITGLLHNITNKLS